MLNTMYCNFGATPSYSETPEERKARLKKQAEEEKRREEEEKAFRKMIIKWALI